MDSNVHSRPALILAALLGSALFAAPASAACTQDRAIYTDRDDAYTLRFKHVPEDQPVMTSNEFSIEMNDSDLKLDGVVMWNEGIARPNGIIMYKCPTGDVTGDELQACTVWRGVIYALKEGADADLLPQAKEPAAQALLLPDFSSSMSSFNFKLEKPIETFPWEVFRFKECVPEQ
ncbi:hypothetical protein [Candidatus Phyllobacterium onerii]|uniref:hypothetical protein n=1 Tax=Candidatus Phyllobacterium onerii TaxID=3020828 RepID=UPI00232F8411|nr:hypothetical protein [Phyllobacterium sp. IY22]